MNVVLIVVDSLRASALRVPPGEGGPTTPFLAQLATETTTFRRAYATECWTLPAHLSMFTGLLPSEHGAHFQHMQYDGGAPTIAEIARSVGHRTELVTRNSIFEGSLPGVNRGFERCVRPMALVARANPLAVVLALSKPRFRRQIRTTGFFHPNQRANRDFVMEFARSTLPADRRALDHVLERMDHYRRRGEAYFIFSNLWDVHAPYSPAEHGIAGPSWPPSGLIDNLTLPFVLPKLGAHRYIRKGFRISERSRRMLLSRYHRAITLMDRKLAAFCDAARVAGLLDDTVLIITSDHGEAFGEHGLYLHDSSVYETHLNVPLWVRWPGRAPTVIDDIVSTKDLFGLMRVAVDGGSLEDTILGDSYRARHATAWAEHFHYRGYDDILPQYRQNLRAAIRGTRKMIVRGDQVEVYDLAADPHEHRPERRAAGSTFDHAAQAFGLADARP